MLQDDKNSPEELRDEIAEQAFSRLAAAWDPQQQAATDAEDLEVRAQLEALAMLAYGLEPMAPSAQAEERLLAAVRDAAPSRLPSPEGRIEPGRMEPGRMEPVASFSSRDPLDRTLQHAAFGGGSTGGASEPEPGDKTLYGQAENVVAFKSRAPSPPPANFSVMALAAALAFCLIGLGYLYGQLNAKNAEIAVQAERLREVPELEATVDQLRGQLRATTDRLAMVNTVARQAYPLRRVGTSPPTQGEEPFGRVFVCGQHQRWYLTVSGLEPAPRDQDYHLWFMTDEGPVDAGIVEVEGGVAGLRDLNMPEDTNGFSLTLEPREMGDQPQGRVILIGDSPVKL